MKEKRTKNIIQYCKVLQTGHLKIMFLWKKTKKNLLRCEKLNIYLTSLLKNAFIQGARELNKGLSTLMRRRTALKVSESSYEKVFFFNDPQGPEKTLLRQCSRLKSLLGI